MRETRRASRAEVTYEFVMYNSHRQVFSVAQPIPACSVAVMILGCHSARCTLECIPQLNYFEGGQPPWSCEGNYEAFLWLRNDGMPKPACPLKVDDDEIIMSATCPLLTITTGSTQSIRAVSQFR